MALTYHKKYSCVSCVCGELITGKHTCSIPVKKIEIVVCFGTLEKSGKRCGICFGKEQEEIYEDQWWEDESGYTICRYCGVKTHAQLPKYCCCPAFIDEDGIPKCKRCKEEWNDSEDMNVGSCRIFKYEGE